MIPADIDLDIEKIKHIFSNLRDGVALADARLDGCPLIYVNHAFERISGYTFDEVNGKNCKFLQGKDTDLEHVQLIHNALKQQRSILVTILNYRNNGETFWNELSISPLLDSRGVAKYFISIQKDVTERILFDNAMAKKLGDLSQECKEMEEKANTDPLTHLYNRRYFDLQFPLQMRMAARHKITTSIFLIDIDYFKLFNDTYGHIQGDKCLQKISETIQNCFNRSSDICARFGGEEFVIFALGMSTIQSTEKAKKLLHNIFQLAIPHAKSNLNYVTASIGIANSIANPNIDTISLLNSADEALYKAKSKGRNTIICA